MSFIIVEHSIKPTKLKGNKVIFATISPITEEEITEGEYVGTESGLIVKLVYVGGFIKHFDYEQKLVPATFDERASAAIIGEIFCTIDNIIK